MFGSYYRPKVQIGSTGPWPLAGTRRMDTKCPKFLVFYILLFPISQYNTLHNDKQAASSQSILLSLASFRLHTYIWKQINVTNGLTYIVNKHTKWKLRSLSPCALIPWWVEVTKKCTIQYSILYYTNLTS